MVRLEVMDSREAVRHAGGMGSLMSRDGRVGRVSGVGVVIHSGDGSNVVL